MKLNRSALAHITATDTLVKPSDNTFELPEKVLQFGTGILLRGLPDFMIGHANKNGIFNGRIVVVKSTATGSTDAFEEQDGLYTVCVRGIDNGKKAEENHIVSSISRVLSAGNEWDSILEYADNPDMQVIISNTTEVGITLIQDNIHHAPPVSFPGKLVAFLYQRFKHFHGDTTKGLVIIPTELIPDNGDVLLSIVLELAHQNNFETAFIDWIENANFFCNSLVDRIVPGKLPAEAHHQLEKELGYTDELMIVSEVYSLWAIESSNEKVKNILSFAACNDGIVIAPDIEKFRELKLRLLNGAHTFACGLAHLAGFVTVKQAMDDDAFANYIRQMMHEEIIPVISKGDISRSDAENFAEKVLDRFRNNFIEHKWLSITAQYASKMNMRNVAVVKAYIQQYGYLPPYMGLSFAAHILFMRSTQGEDGNFYGELNGVPYLVNDQHAAIYAAAWKQGGLEIILAKLLGNESIWNEDLSVLPGLKNEILHWLQLLMNVGAKAAIQQAAKQKKELIR